jgi:hypothetical protein
VCGKGGEYFRIIQLKSVADWRGLCFPEST